MKPAVKWLWMQQTFGIGTRHAHEVLTNCGTPDEVLSLCGDRLHNDKTLTDEDKLAIASPDFSKAEAAIEEIESMGWTVITPDDDIYPERLRTIHSMPMVLYAKGDLSLLSETYAIAMVGMRECDEYGARCGRKIATEIAALGGVVVSGLARGIDSVCHEAALDVGGKTIAFLAVGPDGNYPMQTRDLRKKIEQKGLVVTEFPLRSQVRGHSFHIRNRLISGISLGTVVVEAARHSGSLITAGHAIMQDRDLYAVCGNIFSLKFEGNHKLLAEGAAAAFSGVDIMRGYEAVYGEELSPICSEKQMNAKANPVRFEMPPEPERKLKKKTKTEEKPVKKTPKRLSTDALNSEQEKVYLACEEEISFDELCQKSEISAGALLSILTQLEIFGYIETIPGRRYCPVMK